MTNPDRQERWTIARDLDWPDADILVDEEIRRGGFAYIEVMRVTDHEAAMFRATVCGPYGKTWREACEEAEVDVEKAERDELRAEVDRRWRQRARFFEDEMQEAKRERDELREALREAHKLMVQSPPRWAAAEMVIRAALEGK